MDGQIEVSYAHCRHVARRAASSFYMSFFLLPAAQRNAMCALYAFLRHTDDIADEPAPLDDRRNAMQRWRAALDVAVTGHTNDPILPALVDTLRSHEIPLQYFHDAIEGAMMDLQIDRYATFAELDAYCYRAASVVGLSCLRIWGCRDPQAEEPARQCGLAFSIDEHSAGRCRGCPAGADLLAAGRSLSFWLQRR